MNTFMTRLAWASAISLASLSAANADMNHGTPIKEGVTAAEAEHDHHNPSDHDVMTAEHAVLGDLEIEGAFARATLPGAPVGGGFLSITNNGDTDDRLIAASSDAAGDLQLHNMRMDGEVMKMYQMKDGIPIPAHETVTLSPGGMHVMFMKLNGPLVEDTVIDVELTFEKAGTLTVPFAVRSIAAKGDMNHGDH